MKMTPAMLVIGALLVFWSSIFCIIILPSVVMKDKPSTIWRAWTPEEQAGHDLYVANGCSYCHSQFVRVIDWGEGAERVAQAGDYVAQRPAILGTERTGPDLSQQGGEHPDDWHLAHFTDARFTRPRSLMPNWEFLGPQAISALTAYVQAAGELDADRRVQRQKDWKVQAVSAYKDGTDANVAWLHGHVPDVWVPMPNPYPATDAALARGQRIFQDSCVGCHGLVGDGQGPAAKYLDPPPFNFTSLRGRLPEGKYLGGILYYQIMNGITGTAMPYFKRELESAKIWDVSNYVAVSFVGYTDAGMDPRGIRASYEPSWKNPYAPPPPAAGGAP